MEKEILRVIAILLEDSILRQIYRNELKMLFDMLTREQNKYLQGEATIGTANYNMKCDSVTKRILEL
jgi:hypothetical protein